MTSESRIQYVARSFNLDAVQVRRLSLMDPTHGKYLIWIARMDSLASIGPAREVKEVLSAFARLTAKPGFKGDRDINKYGSLRDIECSVARNADVKTNGEVKRDSEQAGCRKLDEDKTYTLYAVTTHYAAAKLFRNTSWCVKDLRFWGQYTPKRFYYVEKNGRPHVLFHKSGDIRSTENEDYRGPRIKIAEPYVLKSPYVCVVYSEYVIKGRWSKAEPVVMQNAEAAFYYAKGVIKGRWPEAEPVIMKDPEWTYYYARDVIKGRWPEAEPVIMQEPRLAYNYARYVVKGRWPEAEPEIVKDPVWAYRYARYARYAKYVIKGRRPEAEPCQKQ